jgi:predicted MFS family arabinose efflux permease
LALAAIVALWSLFHLFQYLGTVALWSWLGDLAPPRIWGRFVARREQWMLAGAIPAMLASGLFAAWFRDAFAKPVHWLAYALPAALGGLVMLAALIPLSQLPAARAEHVRKLAPVSSALSSSWLAPLRSATFVWFLAFTAWFSLCNGLTQSAQNVFPARVLGLSLLAMLTLQSLLRVGQFVISPQVGAWCDRLGNRPVLIASQLIVAAGIGCYALASTSPVWIAVAHLLWVAYVGLNVGLPGMVRRLAQPGETAHCFAWHLAVSGAWYAVGTLAGGWLVERYSAAVVTLPWGLPMGFFPLVFVAGWLARSAGIVWLWPIAEDRANHARNR